MLDYELLAFVLKHSDHLGPGIRDTVVTFTALYLAHQSKKISASINALNEKIAKVVGRVDSHEERIEALEAPAQPG
jgi:hypothetical protein